MIAQSQKDIYFPFSGLYWLSDLFSSSRPCSKVPFRENPFRRMNGFVIQFVPGAYIFIHWVNHNVNVLRGHIALGKQINFLSGIVFCHINHYHSVTGRSALYQNITRLNILQIA